MEKNRICLIAGMIFIALLLVSSVSADYWACFKKGDKYKFCNVYTNQRICGSFTRECTVSTTSYELCVHSYNETNACFVQGSIFKCNANTAERCSNIQQTNPFDFEPPNLTISSPLNGSVYNSRSILFDILSSEQVTLSYIDNINGRGRWTRLAGNVFSYQRRLSLREGLNDITIKGVDRVGNIVELQKQFFIDSKKPRIRKTEPSRGFADGNFYVEILEENPIKLEIKYGNSLIGYRSEIVNLDSCDYIRGRSDNLGCEVNVNLQDYNMQSIGYWFELTDIANNFVESRHYWLSVDTDDPILNNLDGFWTQGDGRNERYISFSLDIDEPNFDRVTYIDNSELRPRERVLCTRLRNGICERRVSFSRGEHILDIQISDKAGNSIGKRIEFFVN